MNGTNIQDRQARLTRAAFRTLPILGGILFLVVAWNNRKEAEDVETCVKTSPPTSLRQEPAREIPSREKNNPKPQQETLLPEVRVNAPKMESPVSIPSRFRKDPAGLRDWLLSLPDPEFAGMIRTETLREIVLQVYHALERKNPSRNELPREAIAFLGRVNKRILAVRSSHR